MEKEGRKGKEDYVLVVIVGFQESGMDHFCHYWALNEKQFL